MAIRHIRSQKRMIIMQGAPGSGKSTKANSICEGFHQAGVMAKIVSADNFHIKDGVYQFDFTKIKDAHKWAQQEAQDFLNDHSDAGILIVDNTNTQQWEAQPYIDMAKKAGYDVDVIRCEGQYSNIHGVPDDKVEIMRNRLEVIKVD